MNIIILITFLQRESFPRFYLMREKYDTNKSTHGVSLLMVSTQVFHAPFLKYFDQRDALQRVCIILKLNSLHIYSSYRYLFFCR